MTRLCDRLKFHIAVYKDTAGEKLSMSDAFKAVLDYLNKQNRPYSAIDICNNLHKEYGKTAIVKACEGLAAQGDIREKVYGKQKVYVADQSQFPDVDDSEIKTMDGNIVQLTQQLQVTMEEVKKLESELKTLNSCLSTEEAKRQLTEAIKEAWHSLDFLWTRHMEELVKLANAYNCEQHKSKLTKLKEGGNVVSPEEKERVYSSRLQFVKAWRKRKRISNDILNAILEGYPKPKKQLYEDIGIETDEDYSVKPPDI